MRRWLTRVQEWTCVKHALLYARFIQSFHHHRLRKLLMGRMSVLAILFHSRTSVTESRLTLRYARQVSQRPFTRAVDEFHNFKRIYWRHTMSLKEPQTLNQVGAELGKASRKLRSQNPTGRRTQEERKQEAKDNHAGLMESLKQPV